MTNQFLGFRIAKYDGVEIPAPALMLSFSNPQCGAVVWDAQVAEVENGRVQNWISGTTGTGGLATPDAPIYFDINFTDFLLRVMELPPAPLPGPYWLGPYLVALPGLGAYTWNSQEGKIDNIQAVNLPLSNNESDVIGTVGGWNWISEGKWGLSLILEEATSVSGKEDVASLYIGQPIYIGDASYPADSLGNPIIKAGERISCRLKMVWVGYTYGWKAWDFHYPREYPPEAYEFTGGMQTSGPFEIEYYDEYGVLRHMMVYEYRWWVDGNVPTFKASALVARMFMGPQAWQTVVAENYHAEGTYRIGADDLEYGYVSPGGLVANPDPDAPTWTRTTAYLNNWVSV